MSERSRDLARPLSDAETRCMLKQGSAIAAARCVEQQKDGCFCPAGFGSVKASGEQLDRMAADPMKLQQGDLARINSQRAAQGREP